MQRLFSLNGWRDKHNKELQSDILCIHNKATWDLHLQNPKLHDLFKKQGPGGDTGSTRSTVA